MDTFDLDEVLFVLNFVYLLKLIKIKRNFDEEWIF